MAAKDELHRVWVALDSVGFPNPGAVILYPETMTVKELRREVTHRIRKGYKNGSHPQNPPSGGSQEGQRGEPS